ncbi:MAG: addiction module antidote protein [Parvibaculaceae bacterium]
MVQFIKTTAFIEWVENLKDHKGRIVILARLERFEATGNPGDAKPVGGSVSEMRIHFGPGYRVYFATFEEAEMKRMKNKYDEVQFSPYDTAEFLHTPQDIADFLEAIFESYGDEPKTIIKALGTAARARGMQKVADETGLQRQGLYKSLSADGNPSFETVLKVMNAVGVELRPKAVTRSRARGRGGRTKSSGRSSMGKPAHDDTLPRSSRKRA